MRSRSRSRKFRNAGRHKAPSQVQKVAQRAGMAAPAVAVMGALAASPQLQDLASAAPAATPASANHAITAHLTAAGRPAHEAAAAHTSAQGARTYSVRTGDTLSGIAQRFYGHANDWPWLYHINQAKIS